MDNNLYANQLRTILKRLREGFELTKRDKELLIDSVIYLMEKHE